MGEPTFPLCVPASLLAEATDAARRNGVSFNQLIGMALAEKVSALRAEAVLEERARRADRARFDEVMSRAGGTPPREGDEVTER